MRITLVDARVKPEHVAEFIEAMPANHLVSVRESGNLHVEVVQSPQDVSHLLLCEVFELPKAATAGRQTAHYLKWRDAVVDWMAVLRVGIHYCRRFLQAAEFL